MVKVTKKRALYALLLIGGLLVIGLLAVGYYYKRQWFRDTPNTMAVRGNPGDIPFRWSARQYEDYLEPHDAMLIPVEIDGLDTVFHMQFDTGAASTFLRSEAVKALADRGREFEVYKKNNAAFVKTFEFSVGGARVTLTDGRVLGRQANIDWDDPKAANVIGTIGTDFLDQRVCEIDFPRKQMRLYHQRPEWLGTQSGFVPFDFKGRRIVFPVTLEGKAQRVFWDSGCSAFGLLTSRYFYHEMTNDDAHEVSHNANRHGDPVWVHHRASDMTIEFGTTAVAVHRISYADLYGAAQTIFGRFSSLIGFIGFLGNKPFLDCTLVIDAKTQEFLVVPSKLHASDEPSTVIASTHSVRTPSVVARDG